jgi:hypothetical protein
VDADRWLRSGQPAILVAGLSAEPGVLAESIAEMVNGGETVTISGVECERCGVGSDRRTLANRSITVFEITRGGS